jgi:hypothetical protein
MFEGISEVVVTTFVLLILVDVLVVVLVVILNSFFLVGVVFVWLESANGLMLTWLPFLLTKSILGLAHLIMSSSCTINEHLFLVSFVIEDFLFLNFLLLIFELVDQLLLILSSLSILQIVHIKLVFQVVDIGELLNIDMIESFELRFEAFVVLLILWLHILNTLESLILSIIFLLSSGKLIEQLRLVRLE